MRLFGFGKRDAETPEARAHREASEQSVAAGGLPLDAISRLKDQAGRQGTPGHIFTSDLSVNELAIVEMAGYRALGQVMGSSIYQIGWQFTMGNLFPNGIQSAGELTVLSQAFSEARRLAIGRLQQEAQILGATGVVGVRLEHQAYSWGAGLLEFKAIGTAIREADAPFPDAQNVPFVSDVSGQEFWVLRQAGYRPVGLAIGNCSYYCYPKMMGSGFRNQERTDYTQAMYNARSLAMGRMEATARAVSASGVVGADIEVDFERATAQAGTNTAAPDMMYHITCIGTAVAPWAGKWPSLNIDFTLPLSEAATD